MLFAPRMLKALENEGVETIRPVNLTAITIQNGSCYEGINLCFVGPIAQHVS